MQVERLRGSFIGPYKVRRFVGAGHLGQVYTALHPLSGSKVAIKIIPSELIPHQAAFEQIQIQLAALLAFHHPGFVPLLDYGCLDSGAYYLIYEFAYGEPLSEWMSRHGSIEFDETFYFLEVLTELLQAAHQHRLYHGELSSANIILSPANLELSPQNTCVWPPNVRIMDLGLLPMLASDAQARLLADDLEKNAESDWIQKDIAALGELARRLTSSSFTSDLPACCESLASALQDLIARATSLNAPNRFRSVAALAEDLRLIQDNPKRPTTDQTHLVKKERTFKNSYPFSQTMDVGLFCGRTSSLQHPGIDCSPSKKTENQPARQIAFEQRPWQASALFTKREQRGPSEEKSASTPNQALTSCPTEGHVKESLNKYPSDTPAFSGGAIATKKDLSTEKEEPKPLLTPLRSAILAILLASVFCILAYHLVAKFWQMDRSTSVEKNEGEISITTHPPHATVFLNHVRQTSLTPMLLKHLKRGQSYEVQVFMNGYLPWHQTIALGLSESKRDIHLDLKPKDLHFGTLQISTNIQADFFLDTRKVGTQTTHVVLADVQAKVDHQLRIETPLHQTIREVIQVPEGKIHVLRFELQPDKGQP